MQLNDNARATPRVRITYDLETGGEVKKCELPFVVGILADLSGDAPSTELPPVKERDMILVNKSNLDLFFASLNAGAAISYKPTQADSAITDHLTFSNLNDFSPASILARLSPLSGYDAAQANSIVTQILRCENVKKLEASWRGLYRLVSRLPDDPLLKLKVLNISRDELRKDLVKAVEFNQSHLFKLIYEAEYDTYGGEPFSLLLGDYAIGGDTESVELITKISQVAAAAHAPFIAAASAELFGLESFLQLAKPRSLEKIFEGIELEPWREFTATEDARYVALTLPRILLRPPHQNANDSGNSIVHDSLWGNSAYLLAERIIQAFSIYGWTAAITGVENGGFLAELPCTPEGKSDSLCPTEVSICDARQRELHKLGFISLCYCKGTNSAAFFSTPTTGTPKRYMSDTKNTDESFSLTLPYILTASRFAHYVKVIMRNKIGSFLTRANIENYLNSWISNYVLLDEVAAADVQASFPLSAAKIVVSDITGEPGCYNASLFIKPHFQLAKLDGVLRLEINLPA